MELHIWVICGLLAGGIGLMFALMRVWDQRDAAERNAQRWREKCAKMEIATGNRKVN